VLKRAIRTLSTLPVTLLVATGPDIPIDSLDETVEEIARQMSPATIRILGCPDDIVQYIKAADLVVCHGGHTTIMEAVSCGTRVLSIPLSDNRSSCGNKYRSHMSRLGLGDVVSANEIEQTLAQAVQVLLANSELNRGAARLAKGLSGKNGAKELAEYITNDLQLLAIGT
jgi:predicted glycosyltransferase